MKQAGLKLQENVSSFTYYLSFHKSFPCHYLLFLPQFERGFVCFELGSSIIHVFLVFIYMLTRCRHNKCFDVGISEFLFIHSRIH